MVCELEKPLSRQRIDATIRQNVEQYYCIIVSANVQAEASGFDGQS